MTSSPSAPSSGTKEAGNYVAQHGKITLPNPHLALLEEDFLYHIGLSNKTHDLKEMFSDVKFVCFGGSANRMKEFAEFLVHELNISLPAGLRLEDIAHTSDRYVLYKVGPVLSVSHGMGIPSMSIIFHEMLKLIHYAECTDVIFIRIGTSGGIGLEPGAVVITEEAVDGLFQPFMELAVLGKNIQMPAKLDPDLTQELKSIASEEDGYKTVIGKTMCALGFYEGQGRLDGAFCSYTQEDKAEFLQRVYDHGVRNMEMESLCFAAYCHRAGIRGAVVCTTLVNRLEGDQITTPHDILDSWSMRPQKLVSNFIQKKLKLRV